MGSARSIHFRVKKTTARPPRRTGSCFRSGKYELPNQLQCKLNLSRLCGQGVNASRGRKPGLIKYLRPRCAIYWLRRQEVRVIKDVENLRAELNVKGFRDLSDRGILHNRKVNVYKFRSVNGVAAGVAQ